MIDAKRICFLSTPRTGSTAAVRYTTQLLENKYPAEMAMDLYEVLDPFHFDTPLKLLTPFTNSIVSVVLKDASKDKLGAHITYDQKREHLQKIFKDVNSHQPLVMKIFPIELFPDWFGQDVDLARRAGFRFVHLTRNLTDQIVSHALAVYTGVWNLFSRNTHLPDSVTLPLTIVAQSCNTVLRLRSRCEDLVKALDPDIPVIDYASFEQSLCSLLDVSPPSRITEYPVKLVANHAETIENYSDCLLVIRKILEHSK